MQTRFHSCVGPGANVWLLTHPTISTFGLSPTHFYTPLCTHFGLPHPTMANFSWCQCGHSINDLSTHLFRCTYENEHTTAHDTFLGYCHSYYFREWNTCWKGGLPPSPLPHSMTSGYPYYQKWLLDLDGCHRCWPNLHKYDVVNIDDDNTSNNDGCLGENTIIC